mgnify:CR=1 FL=1
MCNEHWENVWSFRTANLVVDLDCTEEPHPDLSWDDTGEVRQKLADGEWTNFLFRVRVTWQGVELGVDHLGNSIHARASDFRDHLGIAAKSRADGCRYGSYFSDMVHEAIASARATLRCMPKVRQAA